MTKYDLQVGLNRIGFDSNNEMFVEMVAKIDIYANQSKY